MQLVNTLFSVLLLYQILLAVLKTKYLAQRPRAPGGRSQSLRALPLTPLPLTLPLPLPLPPPPHRRCCRRFYQLCILIITTAAK